VILGLLLGSVVACATALVAVGYSYRYDRALNQLALLFALLAIPLTIVVLWTNGLLILEGRTRVMNRAVMVGGRCRWQCTLGWRSLTALP
jgi:multisubunit Na+/H+ antiporter MnhB subunit